MPRKNQRFDFRDLAETAGDSCRDFYPFGFDLTERPAVAIERRGFPGQSLPAHDHDVDVLWIKLHSATNAFRELRRGECRATTKERIVDKLATFGVIQNRAAHQLNRLLTGMIMLLFIRSAHDEFGRRNLPDSRV